LLKTRLKQKFNENKEAKMQIELLEEIWRACVKGRLIAYGASERDWPERLYRIEGMSIVDNLRKEGLEIVEKKNN
jgi:hypothetical protein